MSRKNVKTKQIAAQIRKERRKEIWMKNASLMNFTAKNEIEVHKIGLIKILFISKDTFVFLLIIIIFQIKMSEKPTKFDKAEREILSSKRGTSKIFITTLTIPDTAKGITVFLERESD